VLYFFNFGGFFFNFFFLDFFFFGLTNLGIFFAFWCFGISGLFAWTFTEPFWKFGCVNVFE
jgi:hypothetical protein